jgi:multiple sugar transport system permease protein
MPGERGWQRVATAALFLAPSLVPLLAFAIVPMVSSLVLTLFEWNLLRPPEFVGLANFERLLGDAAFHAALVHTLQFVVGYLPLVMVGGLAIALGLHRATRGVALYRTAYFLPVVTSWVVVALMWRWLLNPSSGVVNWALGLAGIEGPGWWADPGWAMPSIILASAWKDLGFVMVIFLAGLQSIPQDYYDAASIDGAGRWARFRHITLPLLSPATFFVVVISLINSFQVFDQVWVMTGGGPAGSSGVVVTEVVRNAFSYSQLGYASAMSWVLFVVILAMTLVQLRLQRRWVTYG